ncbi:universal stress protein [Dechloromonas denitrificans]|uniref:universal stress protein n=1 Tax=Dechloromonas denitrificans TaxID=281362 RepID=UPI001CFA39C6|nr:universal stress protein [Dechloromonas denitrificans]UCV09481.1 universal stress protein [Dechloromonas denitrificans]
MFKHILVPTDGSPLSQAAVSQAIAFARETGARLTFFCAEPAFPTMYYGVGAIFDAHAPARFHEEVASVAHDILTAAAKLAGAAGVECTTQALTSDQPYAAIIAAAERQACDLIFMASHGRRGISGLLLGSETHKVLTHSTIPVLVYR